MADNTTPSLFDKVTGFITKVENVSGNSISGERAMMDEQASIDLTHQGRLAEATVLSVRASIEGAAHITTLPLRIIDAAVCGTIIDCPKDPTPPATPLTKPAAEEIISPRA